MPFAPSSPLSVSSVFDADRLQLPLIEIGSVDVESEDVAGMCRPRYAPVVGDRFDALAVHFEKHGAALDAAVERRAHCLHAGDEDAADWRWQLQPFRGRPVDIPHGEAEQRV